MPKITRIQSVPLELRAQIIPWYVEEGMTAKAICTRLAMLGHVISTYHVYRHLLFHGIAPRSGANHVNPKPYREDVPEYQIYDLCRYGFTTRELGVVYGVSCVTISSRRRSYEAKLKTENPHSV